jgi:transcriptional regulator with XRE-family HTH domain
MNELTKKWITEFQDKETRHIYADNFLNTWIATQLKVLREDREWTQSKLADESGMKQERISVLEDVDYESWTIKTLKRFARAFDLRLSIKFESFGSFLTDYDEFSRDNLKRLSFDKDPAFHPELAAASASASVLLTAGTGKTTTTLDMLRNMMFTVEGTGSLIDLEVDHLRPMITKPSQTQAEVIDLKEFLHNRGDIVKHNVEEAA